MNQKGIQSGREFNGFSFIGESYEFETVYLFTTKMLIRCDEDRKLYLYGIMRTKRNEQAA